MRVNRRDTGGDGVRRLGDMVVPMQVRRAAAVPVGMGMPGSDRDTARGKIQRVVIPRV